MSVHSKLENKWNRLWVRSGVYEPDLKRAKRPFYNLMMFPYPSAEGLHIGGVRTFTGVDIYGRFKRMAGRDVFEPIGLDGFGIHSENYALKIKKHPMRLAKVTEKNFYRQLEMIGNGFAWREKIETYDPDYYKWTQWIFIQMFKRGLAYRKKMAVNWCPSCKTVLADEQVISGECERCSNKVIKKELEQWFFKTTKYAEELLRDLDKIDWPEAVKIAQRNWIGRSEGAMIKFPISNFQFPNKSQNPNFKIKEIEVFTTRPDTLFGATFMVISPELAKSWLDSGWQAPGEVKKHISEALKNCGVAENENKEKTGVFSGVFAINPANQEKIPIWISDYVLAGYGTGAIMAVPAHDQHDFEFAKKFKLPIRNVIEPVLVQTTGSAAFRENESVQDSHGVIAVVKHWTENKYLGLHWPEAEWGTFLTGGIDEGFTPEETVIKEIKEETGYKNAKIVRKLGMIHSKYYHAPKKLNRFGHSPAFLVELENGEQDEINKEEKNKHELVWLTKDELKKFLTATSHLQALELLNSEVYVGRGLLTNSGKFNEIDSEIAKWEITKFVGGERKVQYRLRDWLISRQRYWGPPIPMIFCGPPAGGCGWQPVPEKDLPVKLPFIKNYQPRGTGPSPLALEEKFYKVRCPKCKALARRETDVSDTFLDSAWYFFRYIDHKNKKAPFDKLKAKRWLPVSMYIGGAEHAVLHLLYVRFITKVFNDLGLVDFREPFPVFRTHGLITKDGAKMSKSKGNVVNPDSYFKKFGADAMRMYLAFLSPLDQGGDFRDAGISGLTRFLARIKNLSKKLAKTSKDGLSQEKERFLHQSIKKITEDIENLRYNTAISQLMMLLNNLEELPSIPWAAYETFLKLLAPFAPYLSEELHQSFKQKKTFSRQNSIHLAPWPKFDPKKIIESIFDLVVQINGRVRATIKIPVGATEKDAESAAIKNENVKKYLEGKTPKKTIFVPNKLINFVV